MTDKRNTNNHVTGGTQFVTATAVGLGSVQPQDTVEYHGPGTISITGMSHVVEEEPKLKYLDVGHSDEYRIEQWFYRPLERLGSKEDRDGGYMILMGLFPIYERYMRHVTRYDGNFSPENCGKDGLKPKPQEELDKIAACIEQIRSDFGLNTEKETRAFWQEFRNGLTHRAAVRENGTYYTELSDHGDGPPVYVKNNVFCLDPIKLRDHLLPKFRANPAMWHHPKYPLPGVFERYMSAVIL